MCIISFKSVHTCDARQREEREEKIERKKKGREKSGEIKNNLIFNIFKF